MPEGAAARNIFLTARGRRRIPAEGAGRAGGRNLTRRVNRATVSGRRMGRPPCSMAWAKRVRSSAVENRPGVAGDAARTKAFSSCTSPWMTLVPKSPVVGCGRNLSRALCRRIESGVDHRQRAEYLTLAECVERFVRDPFESRSQHDKSDIAVFGAGAGIGRKGSGKSSPQKFVARLRFEEQLLVGGQA